jgi:hypothetical protein
MGTERRSIGSPRKKRPEIARLQIPITPKRGRSRPGWGRNTVVRTSSSGLGGVVAGYPAARRAAAAAAELGGARAHLAIQQKAAGEEMEKGGRGICRKVKKKAEVIETTWDLESESNRVEARPLA